MAVSFPDTSVNNPATGAPWANGDTWDAPTGATYIYNDDGTNPPYWSVQGAGGGGGGTPNLQDVTDEGATTTNEIVVDGVNIGSGPGTGAGNTRVGDGALASNTQRFNTAIGTNALASNNTGQTNTAVGHEALRDNTTASGVTAVGQAALRANTEGTNNTAVGSNALLISETADNNTALGFQTLFSNTTGEENTATGAEALRQNTEGLRNTAHGRLALRNNVSGDDNTAFGRQALNANNVGNRNTAVGSSALLTHTNGANNIGIGFQAGQSIQTGSNNTVIGSLNGDNGMSDTMLFGAGTNERFRVDENGNMMIGDPVHQMTDAKLTIGNGTSVALGFARTGTGGGGQFDGAIELNTNGEFSFRNGVNSTTVAGLDERMRIDTNGNVTIGGTLGTSPNIQLNAAGSATFASGQFEIDTNGAVEIQRAGETARAVHIDGRGSVNIARSFRDRALQISDTDNSNTASFYVRGDGYTVLASANPGICFGNSEQPADTLDDYEEGTWTPSSGGTATYTTQLGRYTKVGQLVTAFCEFEINALGTGSNFKIEGLPFAQGQSQAQGYGSVAGFSSLNGSFVGLYPFVGNGENSIRFFGQTSAGSSNTVNANIFQDGAQITLMVTYQTAS